MLITANTIRVTSAEIVQARDGDWHADLFVDADTAAALTGPVVIVVGGSVIFRGTAFRPGSFKARSAVRVVGGAGGLGSDISPPQLRGTTVGRVATRLLAEAGETLSPLSMSSVLNIPIAAWAPRAGTAGDALGQLLDVAAPGATWRVLDDGTVWIGTETWFPTTTDVQVLDERMTDGTAEATTELPTLRPGTTLGGRRISACIHRFEPSKVRTHLYFEAAGAPMDRLKAAFFGLARAALKKVDYFGSYSAKVIRQQGDGRLEVRPDDERFKGLAAVAMRPGVHGITTTVRRGARVLFGFENGDPRKAVATGWESGNPESLTVEADAIKLGAGASKGIVRKDDVAKGPLVTTAGNVITITNPDGSTVVLTDVNAASSWTCVGTADPQGQILVKNDEASSKTTAE